MRQVVKLAVQGALAMSIELELLPNVHTSLPNETSHTRLLSLHRSSRACQAIRILGLAIWSRPQQSVQVARVSNPYLKQNIIVRPKEERHRVSLRARSIDSAV